MDHVYLKARDEVVSYDTFDKKVAAPKIIKRIEDGALNYKGFKDGDRLSKIHVCSIICNENNYDPKEVSSLYDEIEAEKNAMASVSIKDAKDEAAYITNLDKVQNHLDSVLWLAGAKAEKGVTTFTALKDSVAIVEPV